MKHVYSLQSKIRRLFLILLAICIYFSLTTLNATLLFPGGVKTFFSAQWLSFGFYTLTSLMFLSIGALVWFYARNRRVALLLFCFSMTMMATSAVETGVTINNVLLSAVSEISSIIAVPLASIFLLLFPKDYFPPSGLTHTTPENEQQSTFFNYCAKVLKIYVVALVSVGIFACATYIISIIWFSKIPHWLNYITSTHYIVGLTGILFTIILSYRRSFSLRERQQLRLFVSGVILSVAPTLILNLLPGILNMPSKYIVSSQYTLAASCLFPLTLGYSVLRYQILVLDSYVRRTVSFVVGFIFLAILIYLSVAFCNILLPGNTANHFIISIIGVAILNAALAPFVWWLAQLITERLFFSEVLHYRRIIDDPKLIADETLDLEDASRLFVSAAVHTFETARACLFVFDESCGYYRVLPSYNDGYEDETRQSLVQCVLQALKPSSVSQNADWLDLHLPAIERLAAARRPLLLSEVTRLEKEAPRGLGRYLTSGSAFGDEDWLLAPVRAQGNMIGILVLGERGDHQLYAGPDFEVVQMLTARFSSVLENARLYARANQHAALLGSLYSASMMPGSTFKNVDEVAGAYAVVAANAASASAELWLLDEQRNVLRRAAVFGNGPRAIAGDIIQLTQKRDRACLFFDGEHVWGMYHLPAYLPTCLSRTPAFPFAWLPLQKGDRILGLLVLAYPRPHLFMKEEMHMWEMFARQCVATLEDVRMTGELLAAYERLKELDALKDRFIMTASHELRTPLTAVMGYIELLSEYNDTLPLEARADFIDKARRGCDELTLLISNIMDASRVNLSMINLELRPVSLLASVMHVLEILEGTIKREHRTVTVAVSNDLLVSADDVRLRQILLNLVTNALRYSEEGTRIDITAQLSAQMVVVHVRDYGLGVPVEEQQRLFERFVRLERDLNSSIRGAGLGLAICKQLVNAMGGHIWVDSSGQPGEGSSFNFSIHLASTDHVQLPGARQLQMN